MASFCAGMRASDVSRRRIRVIAAGLKTGTDDSCDAGRDAAAAPGAGDRNHPARGPGGRASGRGSCFRAAYGPARSRSWAAMPAAMAAGCFERIAGMPMGHTSSAMRSSAMPASRSLRLNRARLLADPMSPT